jgi:hypothetical protein
MSSCFMLETIQWISIIFGARIHDEMSSDEFDFDPYRPNMLCES